MVDRTHRGRRRPVVAFKRRSAALGTAESADRAEEPAAKSHGLRRFLIVNGLLTLSLNLLFIELSRVHEATMKRSTILIVEDDPVLRADIVMTLEEAGLAVIEHADADEALGFLLENGREVAAVLTDINMPGHSDGVHLAEIISRHWPHIGVIVTSGAGKPARDLPARVHFIPKPWGADQVVAAMQELVEAA